eukprot:79037-Karenia_brevis.AAC.1
MEKQLREALENPGTFMKYGDLAAKVKSPRLALKAMGFWHHPFVRNLIDTDSVELRELSHAVRPWVVQLLYHNDLETMSRD